MVNEEIERHDRQQTIAGGAYAVLAFLVWGMFPAYYKLIDNMPTLELLCHRITWSTVLPLIVIVLFRRWHSLLNVLRDGKKIRALCLSAVMMAGNWYLFIWAATNDRVLDSSLGYFIAPLVSILLGVSFLEERLRVAQWIALVLAVSGVAVLVLRFGQVPWLALLIALTFGFYSLIRKAIKVDPIIGLFFETAISLPLTVGYLVHLSANDSANFVQAGVGLSLLLVGTGLISTLPLFLYLSATKRLRLSTIGFLQYILPSCHFALAVWVYDEPFSLVQLLAFGLIWLALAVNSMDGYRTRDQISRAM